MLTKTGLFGQRAGTGEKKSDPPDQDALVLCQGIRGKIVEGHVRLTSWEKWTWKSDELPRREKSYWVRNSNVSALGKLSGVSIIAHGYRTPPREVLAISEGERDWVGGVTLQKKCP